MFTSRLAHSSAMAAAAISLAVCTLSGCSLFGHRSAADTPCVVEIDVTDSVQHSGLLKPAWFALFVAEVAGGCTTQATYASLIGADSQAGTCPPVNLARVPTNGNPGHDEAAEASRRTDLSNQLHGLLACGLAHPGQDNGTDLFGAFVNAGRFVANRPHVHIYILSDMIEQQNRWAFYNRSFDATNNRRLLADVSHAGLIPVGLAGSTVTVLGANVGALSMTPEQLAGMDRFWQSYFAAANATLTTSD